MATFLSSSLTCPATQSGLYEPTCLRDVSEQTINSGLPWSGVIIQRPNHVTVTPMTPTITDRTAAQ
jgi:hypothetical protein